MIYDGCKEAARTPPPLTLREASIDNPPEERGFRPRSLILFLAIVGLTMLLMVHRQSHKPDPPAIDNNDTVTVIDGASEAPDADWGLVEESTTPAEPRPTELPPHPEEADEDDLWLLYRGLNPAGIEEPHLYRLPEWIQPISYDVLLGVEVRGRDGKAQSAVNGAVKMRFRATGGQPSNMLEFHAEQSINVLGLFKGREGEEEEELLTFRAMYNAVKRTHVLYLSTPLQQEEEYVLKVDWTAVLGPGNRGLYETWYWDGEQNRYSLATQGHPMSTRRWMPCFDEPAMKATLKLTVFHPRALTARSNGRVLSRDDVVVGGEKLAVTQFAPTLPISPYLYALSVTDFVQMSENVYGINVSVVLPPPSSAHLHSSLSLARRSLLGFFNALHTQRRVFDKLDFVFLPDHNSAMENVGHLSFGINHVDDYDLYAHEMMHNYFGNLVTLSWWDELWLNEGLTSIYAMESTYGQGSEGKRERHRAAREVALANDALRKTRPLTHPAKNELEALANQDHAYNKGATVLLMLRRRVGEVVWRAGVELYLAAFAFKSARGVDFLRSIGAAALERKAPEGVVHTLLKSTRDFLLKPGFPLVRLTQNGAAVTISQERFHRGFIEGARKEDKQTWTLILRLASLDGTLQEDVALMGKNATFSVRTSAPLILAPIQTGYFRVVYDEPTYRAIAASETLSDQDKEEIERDLVHAAFAGYVEPELLFRVYYLRQNENISSLILDQFERWSLLRPERFEGYFKLWTLRNDTDFIQYRHQPQIKMAEMCKGVKTAQDVMDRYNKNRRDFVLFLCDPVLNKHSADVYYAWILRGLQGSPEPLHSSDFAGLLYMLNMLRPGFVADSLVRLSTIVKDEHQLAEIIRRARAGLDERSTPQLYDIALNAPGAARQNAALITKLFNGRSAIDTEERLLGEKFERAIASVRAELSEDENGEGRAERESARQWRMRRPVWKPIRIVLKPFPPPKVYRMRVV